MAGIPEDVASPEEGNRTSTTPGPLEFEVFDLRDAINIVSYFSMSAGKEKLFRNNFALNNELLIISLDRIMFTSCHI